MIEQTLQAVINWYMGNINYWTVILLMSIESSFIPFPSEIIIPPAAWKAAEGHMNIYLVILSGTIGALVGALFNYYFAFYLGRKIIYKLSDTRLSHALLIDRNALVKSEHWFIRYGKSSTFIGRLVPAIRQLISIPAGFAKMNMKDFLIYTSLGTLLWNIILALLGYYLYSQKGTLERYYREISYGFLALGILFVGYLIYNGLKKREVYPSKNR
jgi:membrane protein DedA with SNARE-associated domain